MLRAKLQEDLLAALKSGEKARLETLRYVMSRVKNQEIELKNELDDTQTIDILRKVKRELGESIESFDKGARTDLAASSREQLAILEEYLPKELSDEELKTKVQAVIEANKEAAAANPKALIGIAVKELKSQADSSRIVATLNALTQG